MINVVVYRIDAPRYSKDLCETRTPLEDRSEVQKAVAIKRGVTPEQVKILLMIPE